MIEITDIGSAAYTDYREYKAALDAELQQSTESFVKIGYMLKLARDTDILQGSGYTTVTDFARAEYNIDKTLVSRFISINDRFSEGGNSDRLKEQYRGFGYAKLAIMLQLPDAVNEEITPAYSKADVLALKEEVDAERAVTDIEVMLEEKNEVQEAMATSLDRVIHQLGHDQPEMYAGFHRGIRAEGEEKELYRTIQEILAPSGEGIHSVRIMGIGRLLLSVKGIDREVTLTNVRSGEKENYTWEQMAAAVRNIVDNGKEVCESYEMVYGEKYPVAKSKEVAPVQPEAGQKKEATKPKMQGKVTKAPKKMPPLPAPVSEKTGLVAPEPSEEAESLMPEDMKTVETVENTMAENDSGGNGTEAPENVMKNLPETAEILNTEPDKGRLTESEAIEILKNNFPKTCKMIDGRYKGGFDDIECEFGQALLLSISALQEIQQYRSIGTVSECREAMEKQKAKTPDIRGDGYADGELVYDMYDCPNCGKSYEIDCEKYKHCPECGQAIDWPQSENEKMEDKE